MSFLAQASQETIKFTPKIEKIDIQPTKNPDEPGYLDIFFRKEESDGEFLRLYFSRPSSPTETLGENCHGYTIKYLLKTLLPTWKTDLPIHLDPENIEDNPIKNSTDFPTLVKKLCAPVTTKIFLGFPFHYDSKRNRKYINDFKVSVLPQIKSGDIILFHGIRPTISINGDHHYDILGGEDTITHSAVVITTDDREQIIFRDKEGQADVRFNITLDDILKSYPSITSCDIYRINKE
ncbi:MAG: hypothetical protein US52_C0022G0003 [candidate division WS6 bacterium GW2011_GWA2_37_6]|uniref:Uncharacterized protein n=1 Tax=candidate division WS6 bacterium GW2011_GWA2_37_6 TaxID=1619087 RepID=A0A0G0JFM3_9BACT|nr:MAG: hypothetical protein US52_C0022G0003 [candidate division WS6 bacterium GW2011_GWA2_37_6]